MRMNQAIILIEMENGSTDLRKGLRMRDKIDFRILHFGPKDDQQGRVNTASYFLGYGFASSVFYSPT